MKEFLIIGSLNAITYKEVFPLIKDDKMWLGIKHPNKFLEINGDLKNFGNIAWWTNINHNRRNKKITLVKSYNKEEYLKYDNYDAINIDRVKDIPKDYYDVIGVPISFLERYNPKQFEILGITDGSYNYKIKPTKRYEKSKQWNKNGSICNGSKINTGPVIRYNHINKYPYYTADNTDGYLEVKYRRILIKRIDSNE